VTVRIAVAQVAPALGAFGRNLQMHLETIERARSSGAALVVFPELSLTGYYLKDLANDLAMSTGDARLAPIVKASEEIDVIAGFVERAADSRVHIAAGYWSKGRLAHVHRKAYLPTYGIFDDGRYFARGERFDTFASVAGQAGIAICEDMWHLSTPYLYAVRGAEIVFYVSASPGRGVAEGGDLGTADSCRLMDAFYAQELTVYVVFANRVGTEDGIAFWGGSEIVAPDGTLVARAPEFEEHLLVAEVDPVLVTRERARNPLLRDERHDLVLRHLAERVGGPPRSGDPAPPIRAKRVPGRRGRH
jgi:predicted amidohydrolase